MISNKIPKNSLLYFNFNQIVFKFSFKGAISGLRQFWATESTLKMIKNAFYLTLKAFLVLKIFIFLF